MSIITSALQQLKQTAPNLLLLNDNQRAEVLLTLAALLETNTSSIITHNQRDLQKMSPSDPRYDRLQLTTERIIALANDLRKVAQLDSPLGKKLAEKTLANGLHLVKQSVPLGVVAVIYEARPNVTIDVFNLCFKSGNAVVLKGGSDAWESNQILVTLIKQSLAQHHINPEIVYLMPPERETVYELLNAVGLVDVCIPRGSQGLIEFVRTNAKIPVIETGAGIVHTYFDSSGNITIASQIIKNAKTRRVSVCNALDCLLVAEDRLAELNQLIRPLAEKNVIVYADDKSYHALASLYPTELLEHATDESFGCEFLDYKIAIKTVTNIDEAIAHIQKFTSGHSEAIISENKQAIAKFINLVDAAVVYINASTAFTDGGEFGMGAEIGISTQKLHARGPMALPELTSYKWVVTGTGQIR